MSAFPKEMLAARLHGRNELIVETVPVPPTVAPGEVRVKVSHAGICGSDLHEIAGAPMTCRCAGNPHPLTGETMPTTLGHEFSGTIVELGEGVTTLKVGNKVAIEPIISCWECENCLAGNRPLCSKSLGFFGYNRAGGLAPYVNITEKNCHIVPDEISLRDAALVEPLSVAWHAVRQSGLKEGDTVLVLGSGPIGALVTRVLKARGASWVAVSEPGPVRAAIAEKCGADAIYNPIKEDVPALVAAATGGKGVDISIDCAGFQSTFDAAMKATRPRGTVVMVALWEHPAKIDFTAIVQSEKKLTGSCCFNAQDAKEVLEALSSGKIVVSDLVTGVIALKDINEQGIKALQTQQHHIKILVNLELEDA